MFKDVRITLDESSGQMTIAGDLQVLVKYLEENPAMWLRLMALKEEENNG